MAKNASTQKSTQNSVNNINAVRNEWLVVAIISFFVVLLSFLPLIFGYATQGQSEIFMGVPVHVTDANSHLHLILQVKEGAILTTNKFTGEDVPALLFNPYHLILGWTAFIFGLSAVAVYIIYGVLFAFLFLFVLYLFISEFIKDKSTKLLAFILTALASGLAFWWSIVRNLTGYNFGSAEMWVTDMNVFTSLGQPHFVLSMALLLLVFLFAHRSFERKDIKNAVYAGLVGLLLTLIHIFDTVTFAFILVAYFIFRVLKRGWSWREFNSLLIIGLIVLPGVLYYAWVFVFNPAYAEWNSLNQVLTPRLVGMISGFGIALFLSLVYMFVNRKQIFSRKLIALDFLVIWFVANFILIYIPSNVQLRFSLGMFIPMCVLSAIIIIYYCKLLFKKTWIITSVIVFVLLLMSATTIYITVLRIQNLHSYSVGEYGNVKYLPKSEYDALLWIDENIKNENIIFAPHKISNFIPAVTGNKIYSGHWAQTINFTQKYDFVSKTYNNEVFPDSLIAKSEVDYVWWNEKIPGKTPVYANNGIYIYDVRI